MCVAKGSEQDFNARPAMCDSRILPVKLNALEAPERSLGDAVAASVEVEMGWKLTGPGTSRWCLNYLSIEGLGFEAHHERFRQLCRIDSGAWRVQEHFQLSMILRQLILVDQYDACNSYGIELMFRRVQTIEYAHAERARELESKNVGGKLSLEEQSSFGSLVRQAGTLLVMIAPVSRSCQNWKLSVMCNPRKISGRPGKNETWRRSAAAKGRITPELAMAERGTAPSSADKWANRQEGPGRTVPRDIFPLPVPTVGFLGAGFSGSRSVKRRLERAGHRKDRFRKTVEALKSLYSGERLGVSRGNPLTVSESQGAALDYVFNSVRALGPPPVGLSGSEALRQLRVFDGYGEDQTPSAVKSYEPALLSLPADGSQPVPLATLLGEGGQKVVDDFCTSRLLGENDARAGLKRCGVTRCYSDPKLLQPKVYEGFIRRLLEAGVVELSLEKPTELVEAFFVGKKDGRLRLVIDCRRSNEWFCKPDKVNLCTVEALSRIDLHDASAGLYVATADLKDAFYHLELPLPLRPYFGMRPVTAAVLGTQSLGGHRLQPSSTLFPRLRVLPMGWAHALWFCQTVHQSIVGDIGADAATCLQDKASVPQPECMHLETTLLF